MLTRRFFLAIGTVLSLAACGTMADPSTWFAGKSVNQVLAVVAQDASTIAGGLRGALPAIGAASGMTPANIANVGVIIADIQSVAGQLATSASTTAAQPLVQQLAGDVNAVIAALQGVTTLPPQVQLVLTAASVLLPVIMTAVDLLTPPPVAVVAQARKATHPLSPDEARAILIGASHR